MIKKAEWIVETLEAMFPNAKAELDFTNNFELLVAVVLSAQTTDVAVNKVTPTLFKSYPNPNVLSNAKQEDVENHIKSIGLYRNKAKHLIGLSKKIVEEHNGIVPNTRKELEALPGVGRKTANVVLANAFNKPTIAVDTHVQRVSIRLGLAKKNSSPLQVENSLYKIFPKDTWIKLHHQLIFFGRYQCLARNPRCHNCPFFDICKFPLKEQYR
ncbi:MAG TPA: endonuclease III [Acholeplasma sp.]|jgi:endonuclease-3|nr:endonuclease III [Acholeplasmatales bacterium]HHV33774.1 endonuclease III [Acholeplasma sp.]